MAVATTSRPSTGPRKRGRKRGRRHSKKRGFFRRFWWLWILIALPFVALAIVVGILYSMYQNVTVPPFPNLDRTSYVYDREGKLLTTFHAAVDRTEVKFEDISPEMRQAIVSAEDKTFWTHHGVDPVGIVRAAWADILNRAVTQGGSTITQQLVKNLFTGGERTIQRKIEEAMLAVKLEANPEETLGIPSGLSAADRLEATKEEILTRYLNTIYFGHGAYGIEAAAETYYSTTAKKLNLNEAATLAGVVAAPTAYDPLVHPQDAQGRRDYVVDRMVIDTDAGTSKFPVTQAEADKVKHSKVKKTLNPPDAQEQSYSGDYFAQYAREVLVHQYSEQAVTGGGLKIRTTLNMDLQKDAEKAVGRVLRSDGDPDAALVAIDPKTGEILAMYGGPGFGEEQFNLATQAERQAGSAFKPFTLAAAMEAHYNLHDLWYGPQTVSIHDSQCDNADGSHWQPGNAADGEAGTFTLEDATANSVNTVFAQLVVAPGITPQKVADVAKKMGIKDSPLAPVCSITLGTNGVTPLEMTSAYATLADQGSYVAPTPIINVKGHHTQWQARPKQALDPNDANMVTEALQKVVSEGTGVSAQIPGLPVAGKTGTTQDYKNAWFCGYTTDVASCVWVGYKKHEKPMLSVEGYSPVFGGTIPAAIWKDFMEAAYHDEGGQWDGADFVAATDWGAYDRQSPLGSQPSVAPSTPAPPTDTTIPSPSDRHNGHDEPSPTPAPSTEPSPGDGGGGGGGGGNHLPAP